MPRLIGRVAMNHHITEQVKTTVILTPRGAFEQQAKVEKRVRAAALAAGDAGGILIMFDSDGRCPAILGPRVHQWASRVASGRALSVVVAHHEYEAWLLAGAVDLGGVGGLKRFPYPPANPESLADAKGWLSDHLPGRARYLPTEHQARFTERFNMREARKRADSFDKCYREIARLLTHLTQPAEATITPPLSEQSS